VVAVTASVMPDEQERFQRAGFDQVIRKPISVHTFLTDLTQWVNGSSINS
jgi:CheY-like chemotaxis protein